uniref:Uncharacterized protein n=1 Tax=Heterosigma akashiwo TaxID=2829 RepID=A0A6V1V2H3_HETAK
MLLPHHSPLLHLIIPALPPLLLLLFVDLAKGLGLAHLHAGQVLLPQVHAAQLVPQAVPADVLPLLLPQLLGPATGELPEVGRGFLVPPDHQVPAGTHRLEGHLGDLGPRPPQLHRVVPEQQLGLAPRVLGRRADRGVV